MFGKKKEAPVEIVEQPKEEVKAAVGTVIAAGVAMIGDFEGTDPIQINGSIKGTINAKNSVVITKGGKLMGDGKIQNLTVSGSVDGDFVCKDIAVFKAGGEMTGHLKTARLQTEDGSHFRGNLDLVEEEPAETVEPALAEENPALAEENPAQ